MEKNIKLSKKIIYKGIIKLLTGLHIGGTNAAMNIGGPDKFVVRNPINNLPYIPGSSLKGKMRSLIEIAYGESENGKPSNNPNSKSGKLFGISGDNDNSRPSRIIVRDAELISDESKFENTDLPFTESKTEVCIDRITSKANPRTFERVPAGAEFGLNIILNIFEGEDENELKTILKNAIRLIEDDYLGGHGSRGYGQIKILLDEPIEKTIKNGNYE